MAKTRIVDDNLALTATITASSEVSTRPASYLKSPARWKKWRSTTTTGDQNVVFDFGSSKTIKAVLLVDWKRHGTSGTIRADYWDGAAYQTLQTFTIPSFNPTKVIAVWNTAGQATSRIRLYFTNVGGVNDYVELGVAVVGTYYQPTYTLIDGFEVKPVDPSLIVAAVDGQEEAQARTIYHIADGTFELEPEADLDSFRTVFDRLGFRKPFGLAIDPDDPDEMLYCRLTTLAYEHGYGDNWTIPVSVQEVR